MRGRPPKITYNRQRIPRGVRYVYVYKDPRDGLPFYVGVGRGQRAYNHLSLNTGRAMGERIMTIVAAGLLPIIEIQLTDTPEMDERALIRFYVSRDYDLINLHLRR